MLRGEWLIGQINCYVKKRVLLFEKNLNSLLNLWCWVQGPGFICIFCTSVLGIKPVGARHVLTHRYIPAPNYHSSFCYSLFLGKLMNHIYKWIGEKLWKFCECVCVWPLLKICKKGNLEDWWVGAGKSRWFCWVHFTLKSADFAVSWQGHTGDFKEYEWHDPYVNGPPRGLSHPHSQTPQDRLSWTIWNPVWLLLYIKTHTSISWNSTN